jgi:hypothetical protein
MNGRATLEAPSRGPRNATPLSGRNPLQPDLFGWRSYRERPRIQPIPASFLLNGTPKYPSSAHHKLRSHRQVLHESAHLQLLILFVLQPQYR